MNLFLALFWLLVAAALFAYERSFGRPAFVIGWGEHRASGMWLVLALAAFNVWRWWNLRRASRRMRARREESEPRP